MDALDEQVDTPLFAQIPDKLLLHLIEIIEGKLLGDFRGWSETRAFWCTLVETFQPGIIDCLADRFTTGAAEVLGYALDLSHHIVMWGYGQATVETGLYLFGHAGTQGIQSMPTPIRFAVLYSSSPCFTLTRVSQAPFSGKLTSDS